MTFREISTEGRIWADSVFLNAVARPGVIFLVPAEGDLPRLPWSGAHTSVHRIRVGDDGEVLIGEPNADRTCWVELGIKPVGKVFLVGWEGPLLASLAALGAEAVSGDAVELMRAQAEGYEASVSQISRKNAELFSEVYALRLAVEEAQIAQFEMQEAFRRRGSLIPWVEATFPPNNGAVVIGEAPVEIEQVLAVNPIGLAGFDIYMDWPPCEADIDLVARLFVLDSGAQVGEWKSNLLGVGGWLHFRLGKALGDIGIGLVLRLSAEASEDGAGCARIGISSLSDVFGAEARRNGEVMAGQALSYRLWKAPAGTMLPHIRNQSAFALAKTATPMAFAVSLNWKLLPQARLLEPFRQVDAAQPGMFSSGDHFVQVHPIGGAISLVRIPRAFEPTIREIAAEVGVDNPEGPFVQFALAIVPSDSPDEAVEAFDERGFVAFSGWTTAGAAVRSAVSVSVPAHLSGFHDLVLATRVPDGGSTDFGWARFFHFRGIWHPEHSFPIQFNPPADFEPLKLLRDELCTRRARFHDTKMPLVTVVSCVHRPEDIPNLIRQLLRQNYPHIENLVALNGPDVSSSDRERLELLLPRAKVWIDEGRNLPAVLNSCVKKAGGELFFKIDADDVYGDEFVSDLVREAQITQAAIVGKSCFGVWFSDEGRISLHRSHPHHQYVPQIAGGTMCIRTELLRKIPFDETYKAGSDYKLQLDFAERGHRIWSADPFNYLHIRLSDEERHTWKGTPRDYKRWPNFRAYGLKDRWLFFV